MRTTRGRGGVVTAAPFGLLLAVLSVWALRLTGTVLPAEAAGVLTGVIVLAFLFLADRAFRRTARRSDNDVVVVSRRRQRRGQQ
jgi:tetrahydromethanopterin S-methyltransferase subunit E